MAGLKGDAASRSFAAPAQLMTDADRLVLAQAIRRALQQYRLPASDDDVQRVMNTAAPKQISDITLDTALSTALTVIQGLAARAAPGS